MLLYVVYRASLKSRLVDVYNGGFKIQTQTANYTGIGSLQAPVSPKYTSFLFVFVVGVRVICTMHVPRVLLAIGNTTTATLEVATYITQPPTLKDLPRN